MRDNAGDAGRIKRKGRRMSNSEIARLYCPKCGDPLVRSRTYNQAIICLQCPGKIQSCADVRGIPAFSDARGFTKAVNKKWLLDLPTASRVGKKKSRAVFTIGDRRYRLVSRKAVSRATCGIKENVVAIYETTISSRPCEFAPLD